MVFYSRHGVAARLALLLITCLGTVGCIAPYPKVLAPQLVAGITTTHVDVNLSQDKLNVQFFTVGAEGQGLLIKGIAGSMNKSAKEQSEDQARKFQNVDVRRAFLAAIFPVVKEAAWLKAEPPQEGREPWPEAMRQNRCWAPTIAHGSNLLFSGGYHISQNARVFGVASSVRFCVLGQAEPLSTESAILQAGSGTMYLSAGVGPEEGDPSIKLWTADNGAAYQKAVAEGVAETAKMLRYALQVMGGNPPKPLRQASIKVELTQGRGAFGIASPRRSMDVAIFEESRERILFQQLSDGGFKGDFFSIAADDVEFIKP